jgi:radical SAM superfamily enzyme YgiQ (UPF0313 family)
MNVILIYPDHADTFWGFNHALKFVSKKVNEPPLGLLTVASMLPAEWKKKLIQMKVQPLKDKHLEWADIAFIGAMSIQQSSARQVIERCKKKGLKIVAGGPLFSSDPGAFDDVDHLVLNEAEITLRPFLEDLKKGCAKHLYTSAEFPDMGATPVPMWELIKMKNYATIGLQYSRGCPFNCDFCNITSLYGHQVRTKTKDQVIAELESLYIRGWRSRVFFVDDNFIGNKKKLKEEILPAMIKWMEERGRPFDFKTEASINLADDDHLMTLMVQAGFDSVFIGIETPDEQNLMECNKVMNKNRDLLASVKKIQAKGLQVDAGFIVGFDNDAPSTFDGLSAFIRDSAIITAMVGLLNAPRGTNLFKRLDKEGRLLDEFSGDNTGLAINFIPKMDKKKLMKGYNKIISSIYLPEHYYKRVKANLQKNIPKHKKKFSIRFCDIKALFKSIIRLGILGKERRHYWKLFFWAMFKCPRQFPSAITYSIYGFHFRKIFKDCFTA